MSYGGPVALPMGRTRFQRYPPIAGASPRECASNCKAFSYITCGRAAGFAACDVSRRLFGYELTGGSSVAGPLAAASHFDCCAFCSASSECTGWCVLRRRIPC